MKTWIFSIGIACCFLGCAPRESESFKSDPPVLLARKENDITILVATQSDFKKAIELKTIDDLFQKFHVATPLRTDLAPSGAGEFTGTITVIWNKEEVVRTITMGRIASGKER